MLRDRLFDRTDHRLETDSRFRWRGDGVNRVENLSDIVFALALGMVVSASAPPQTFGDLQRFLFGTIPVAAAFVLLVRIWHQHFLFFRRFGLSSTPVLLINAALLFTILYLAYPLRFAFEALFAFVVAQVSDWGPGWARSEAMELTFARSGTIMAYFAGGYAVVHLLLGWLYSQGLAARGALELDSVETGIARAARRFHFGFAALAVAVGLAAWISPLNGAAGALFFLAWPVGVWAGRAERAAATRRSTPEGARETVTAEPGTVKLGTVKPGPIEPGTSA